MQLFTGLISRGTRVCTLHGTMSSGDSLYNDILHLTGAELRREMENNSLPTTGKRAGLTRRLYQFMKRNVNATKRGFSNAPIQSTRPKESISKTPSRIPRLSQKIGEQSNFVSLDTASVIHDQDVFSVQFEDNDTDMFGYSKANDKDNIVQEISEMKELINTQSQMVHQIEKEMDVKIQSWSTKILEAVERKNYAMTDTSIDDIGNSNMMEKLYRKYKFYGSAIEIML